MKEKNQNDQGDYLLVNNSLVSTSANTFLSTSQMVECGGKFRNLEGMSWAVTCLFIVGETAGGGLIAMPTAMISTGLFGGLAILLLGAIVCALTGLQLSENWTILQQRWPEYRCHTRKPYPAMGLRAVGPRFMTFVSACLNITMFGTAVVFLLLASKNIENFLQSYTGAKIGFCHLVIIVAIFMLPLTMLKSPKDFWWAVIGAMITTSFAVGLIVYGSFLDYSLCSQHANYPPIHASRFMMSFGTVMFAYGGHGAFPTIQHDMKKPFRFRRSVCFAYLIIFSMYLPVSIMGYLTYGDSLQDSIIPSLQDWMIQQFVNILITLHVVLALTIMFNPLNQEIEEFVGVPQEWGLQRFVTRTATMIAVVFVAETVPNFGVLLDLVGGSTMTLMALVFPVIFNLYLSASNKKYDGEMASDTEEPLSFREVWAFTPWRKRLLFALVGGTVATISALNAMLSSKFSAPCYAGLLGFGGPTDSSHNVLADLPSNPEINILYGQANCCGAFRNVSRFGDPSLYCMDPALAHLVGGGSHG